VNLFDNAQGMVFLAARYQMTNTITTKLSRMQSRSRFVGIWQHRCAAPFGIVGHQF
jgi:hypothetical protein